MLGGVAVPHPLIEGSVALWELIVYSVLSQKEHRYVLPIVPIASI